MKLQLFVIGLLFCLQMASPTFAAGKVSLDKGDKLSVTVEDATLQEVMESLAEAQKFTLIERGPAPEDILSFTVEVPDWESLLKKLLRQEGYAATWPAAEGPPETLVIYWELQGDAPAAILAVAPPEPADHGTPVFATDDIESRIRAAAADILAPKDHAGEAIGKLETARLRQSELGASLLAAQNAGSSETQQLAEAYAEARNAYLESLQGLENYDEARSVAALLPSLEEDRDARFGALETMRWLSQTGQDPDAVVAATGIFQSAEDPQVERAAMEVLVRYGDPGEVMALLEPLALAEGPNQDLAAREWIRIRDEAAARERVELEGDPQLEGND